MKNFFRLASGVLVLVLMLLIVPISAGATGDVEVVATADPTLLFDGDTTHIEVEVINNTASAIMMDSLFADGQTDTYPGLQILPGASETFDMYRDVRFAGNLDYGFRVEAHYNGGQVAYSNLLEFFEDIVAPPIQPAVTTVDFSVTANKTHVKKGGEVTYTIIAKNTGDVDYENFVVEYVEIGVLDAATFDLAQGESKTITYKVNYDIDTLVQFGYHFNYWDEGDYLTKQCPDYIEKMIYIIEPGLTVTAAPASQTVMRGEDAVVTVTADNTGDIDFESVTVLGKDGKQVGSADMIAAGGSKDFTITFAPESDAAYVYTVKAKDSGGNDYEFHSNDIEIAVSDPAPTPTKAEPTEPVEPTASAEPDEPEEPFWDAEAADSGGIGTLGIVLIAVAAVLLAATGVLAFLLLRNRKGRDKPLPPREEHDL